MTARPLILTAADAMAMLNGSKWQHRTPIPWDWERPKPGPRRIADAGPFGKPRDKLWVQEPWATARKYDTYAPSRLPQNAIVFWFGNYPQGGLLHHYGRLRAAGTMPRRFSRCTLIVKATSTHRINRITQEEAAAEGLATTMDGPTLLEGFAENWERGHAAAGYGWWANPKVWAATFRRIA